MSKTTNELVLEYCRKYGFICWKCPKCGLFTMNISNAYHEQIHGKSEIFYNGLTMQYAKEIVNG